MPIARLRIPNMHRWYNWEAVFCMRPMRQLHDATVEEQLGEVFCVQFVLRCYKQDEYRVQLVVRQLPVSKELYMEVERLQQWELLSDD
jgi:hypothetical protein